MATIERRETSRGLRYRVRWWENGKRVEKWFADEELATKKKLTVELEALDGGVFDTRRGKQTLNSYFDDNWLPHRIVKGRPLADSTRVGYKRLWERHIRDGLGRKQLLAVKPETVREWHARLVKKSGHDQAAKAYRLLRAVTNTAESDGIIRYAPCRIRGAGQEHSAERPMVETSLVLALADAIDPEYRAIVMLAGFAALRTGESLGLRRRDVNLLHGTVSVVAQSQELEGGQRFLERTKSDAGRRTVALPRVVSEALEHHLAHYTEASPDAVLFTGPSRDDPRVRVPLRRATLSDAWREAKAAVGAPDELRPHDLRHHAATLAARMPGVTLKELMARIGHSSPVAALRYQHATSERDREIASFLDNQISAAGAHSVS